MRAAMEAALDEDFEFYVRLYIGSIHKERSTAAIDAFVNAAEERVRRAEAAARTPAEHAAAAAKRRLAQRLAVAAVNRMLALEARAAAFV